MVNLRCGSAHCSGGHQWIFEGTDYARLNSVNCYPEKQYTENELSTMNKTPDLFGEAGKAIWNNIRERKEGKG